MPTSIATIQIDAAAVDVYRYLSAPHLISEWVSGLRPGKLAGGDSEVKLGLRSPDHAQTPAGKAAHEPEIFGFSPDHSVSMRIESAGFIMHTRFHLFESAGITTVRQSVKLSYKKWYTLFRLIRNKSVQKKIENDLQRLKTRVERERAGRAAA